MLCSRLFRQLFRKIVFSGVAFVGLSVLTHRSWLPLIYRYLDVSETPKTADAIVVLGGGSGRRVTYASELFHKGFAPTIIVSGYTSAGWNKRKIKILQEKRIPSNRILINGEATTTFNEAQQILGIMASHNLQSALIVTDKFHSRRAQATYQHIARDQEIDLTVVSLPDHIAPSSWWKSELQKLIALEFIKIPYYWVEYGVWAF